MKKISVVLPCYNVEKYISECMDSIVRQTIGVENLEIIAVDNGSTDNTVELLAEYEKRYPNSVLLVRIAENQMPGYARNIGLSYASAPYTMFVDSDDILFKEAMEEIYPIMKEKDLDILEFDYASGVDMNQLLPNSTNTGEIHSYDIVSKADRKVLFAAINKSGVVWNKIYKTSFLKENELFFAEGLKHEDTIFALMILLYAKKYGTYQKCLYGYRLNDSGITFSVKKNDYGQFDRTKVQILTIAECDKRGLLEQYYDIIEANFLRVFYVETMEPVIRRFEHLPKEEIHWMQETVKQLFPNYKMNYFINLPQNRSLKEMLETVEVEFTEEIFQSMKQK